MNAAAFAIHSEIHRARPDVIAIAHAHTRSGRAWSATGRLLEPLSQDASAFYERPRSLRRLLWGRVRHRRRRRTRAALGDKKALLLQHHGLLTVGETVDEAAFWLHLLERCCEAQLLVASLTPNPDGSAPYRALDPAVAAHTRPRSANTSTAGWGSSRCARRSCEPTPTSSIVEHEVHPRTFPKGPTCRTASCCGPPATWPASPAGRSSSTRTWSSWARTPGAPRRPGATSASSSASTRSASPRPATSTRSSRSEPDVVGYYPIMRTEAIPEHVDTICRFLEAGINVVSTANLITGRWWDAEERFAESGAKGNASLFASGVNPGFVNQLMLTATGVCSEVRKLSVWEEAECSGYDSPELWETVAFGHDPVGARPRQVLPPGHRRVRGHGGDDGRGARARARRDPVRARDRAGARRTSSSGGSPSRKGTSPG